MTNRTRFAPEYVVNVNSIVKVNHTVKCEITLLLNDKQDEVPSRIFRECLFYSQIKNTNAKYMTIQDRIRKYMILYDSIEKYSIDMKPLHEVK